MNPATDDRFLDLLQQYLANTLPDSDHALLEAKLESSPEYFDHFLEEVSFHSSLHRFYRGVEHAEVPSEIECAIDCDDGYHDTGKTGRKRSVVFAVAAAAVLVLFSLIGFDLFFGDGPVPEGTIAHVAYEHAALWQGTEGSVVESELVPGMFELVSGMVRLDFVNGVIVTLEGPARYEILSENHTALHSGRLTAKIPPQAVGFTVESPEMRIVDYGTVFGVNVDRTGTTETLVFRGRVNVSKAGPEDVPTAERAILAGQAVRAGPGEPGISDVAFDGTPFASSWPVMFGILDTDGDFRFVPPGAPHDITGYEDDQQVIVFPEREEIVLATDLVVNITESGKHEDDWFERETVKAGTRVRSYLLAWQPSSVDKDTDKEIKHLTGRIVFDHPIVGLITEADLLQHTSGLLGDGYSNYEDFAFRHSLEKPITPYQTKAPGGDALVLSEDRRTLDLEFKAMRGGGDFFRVVVDVGG